MSRRIAYVFAVAACAAFAAPASADRECFDNTCRMPEVIEPPEAPRRDAGDDGRSPAVRNAALRSSPSVRCPPAPQSISPQMIVDQLPRPALRPSPHRPVEPASAQAGASGRHGAPSVSNEPVEVVNRRYAGGRTPCELSDAAGAGMSSWSSPGVQYGADGVGDGKARQNPSWELCQRDRRDDGRCSPYNYQPYGAYGYRPLGTYRPQRAAPALRLCAGRQDRDHRDD